MEENIKYFNDKTTKRELKGQLVKKLKGLGDSLKAKNKNFEGVCVESVGKDKFKMYVGPDYGYDALTVAVLSDKKMNKELSANVLLFADKYLATIDGDFQIKAKGCDIVCFGKHKIYAIKDVVVFLEI